MSQPLVSVIIPSYNHARYVGQAIDSALAQTWPHIEVIVIDDGSTDDTQDRLKAYGNRIRNIHQQNQGLSAARNTGIREAKGDWLAFLDSDDAFHPRKLELQQAWLAKHPDCKLIATDMFSDEPVVWCPVDDATVPATTVTLEMMAIKPRFAPSSVVAHRDCFAAVGDFDTSLRSVEDREMWLRIGARFPMARLDIPLTWYRVTPGSMSTNPERMEHFELLVLERAFAMPALSGNERVKRLALSHCYRSSAYTFYHAGRYAEARSRLWKSIRLWPRGFDKIDQVPAWNRTKLMLATWRQQWRSVPVAAKPGGAS
jgi:glycosyltransferase involved in cell wall biosynthesis